MQAMLFRVALCCCLFAVSSGTVVADSNWPGWRGPTADGHSSESGFPVKWDNSSVTWQVPLPGVGQSSPTIWGEQMFLTTALDGGRQRMVFCVDRNNGQILWKHIAWTGQPERSHDMNGHASATCATDGEHVYAFFGQGGGVHCYTVDGAHVWSKNLGPFFVESGWGTAACPVIVGDLVIQNCDADRDARIVALDKLTGDKVWEKPRDNFRGWSTPILIQASNRQELVLNGHTGVRAYNPLSGEEYWFCKSFNGRGTPTVTPGSDGLLHVVNGLSGDFYSIRPGGSGDVTATHMAWHTERKGRDLPSPIRIGDHVFVVGHRGGIMSCYNATTGLELWKARLGDTYSASPISYDGLALFINESGETVVFKPGDKANLIAKNKVGTSAEEIFRATITPSDGQLFIRSNTNLYCIGERTSGTR